MTELAALNMIGFIAALATFAILQESEVQKAPDRSGEPALRALMDAAHRLRDLHITVEKAQRNGQNVAFFPDWTLDAEFASPTQFVITRSDMWGDSIRVAFDGKAFLNDPLSDYQAATLVDATGDIGNASPLLGPGGYVFSPLWLLLAGSGALERLVPKEGAIHTPVEADGWATLQWTSPSLGTARVVYQMVDGLPVIDRIEYDELPRRQSNYRASPEWYEAPENPLTVETVRMRPATGLSIDLDRLKPPNTVDSRNAKGS